ncbi:uncharacterized protein phf11 [Symphorus nematophorus]
MSFFLTGDSIAAGPSAYSSDSNSSNSTKRSHSKRRLSFNDKQDETPSKRKSQAWKKTITDDSSDSDNNEPDADMAIFAPLESDIDGSANSVSESQDAESESLLPPVKISIESQSLLTTSAAVTTQTLSTAHPSVILPKVAKSDNEGPGPEPTPVHSPDQHIAGPSVPQQTSSRPPHSPDHSKPCGVLPDEPICVSLLSSPASPASPPALPLDREPSIDSTSFWKSCNVAGCTQAIFADFINEMNKISSRIQSDQASQEDYDFALRVMEASGKLAELVTKQQEVLQSKQMELEKAEAAMKKVVSALRR